MKNYIFAIVYLLLSIVWVCFGSNVVDFVCAGIWLMSSVTYYATARAARRVD